MQTDKVPGSSRQVLPPSIRRKNREKGQKRLDRFIKEKESSYVFFDIERAAGDHDSEIVQISAVSGHEYCNRKIFNSYVDIVGNIDHIAANKTHRLKTRDSFVLKTVGEIKDVLLKFLNYLKSVKE